MVLCSTAHILQDIHGGQIGEGRGYYRLYTINCINTNDSTFHC